MDHAVDQVLRRKVFLEDNPDVTIVAGRDEHGRIMFTASRDGKVIVRERELRDLLDRLGAE